VLVARERKAVLKRITTLVVAALMMMALAVPAFAVSPSQRECEAQNDANTTATFDRDRGEVSCNVTEEGKNPKFTREQETTGQGNIQNKEEVGPEECEPTGSGKCPGGQFK
jgi:predicted lipoprotein with Yx(FWY)xxD motif